MNGKKCTIIFVCIISAMIFTACARLIPSSKHNIHTSYKEWAEQIGLYSTENVKVSCYDGDNLISVGAEYENGLVGYKELCEMIDAHNKFVDENPDYFPSDIKILFYNEAGGEQPNISVFFNKETDFDWLNDYIKELRRPYTSKIQYMSIDMEFANTELEASNDLEINIPVIILQCHDNSYTPRDKIYEFLSEFKNAEKIILDYYQSPDFDKKEICNEIHKYLPNVEIYTAESEDGQHYLEKCQ